MDQLLWINDQVTCSTASKTVQPWFNQFNLTDPAVKLSSWTEIRGLWGKVFMPGCMSPERQKWMVHHVSPVEIVEVLAMVQLTYGHLIPLHGLGGSRVVTVLLSLLWLPAASVNFEGYSQHKTLEVPYFLLGETCLQNPQVSSQSHRVIKKATYVHAVVSDFDRLLTICICRADSLIRWCSDVWHMMAMIDDNIPGLWMSSVRLWADIQQLRRMPWVLHADGPSLKIRVSRP